MLKDTDKMPWGKFKLTPMIDVPASYLLWLWDNVHLTGDVYEYVKDNLDVLKSQVKNQKK